MGKHLEFKGESWNPVTGCDDISEGCRNCYARYLAKRKKLEDNNRFYQTDGICGHFTGTPDQIAPGFGLKTHPEVVRKLPPTGREKRRVFVNSMSDTFHKNVPLDFIKLLYAAMTHPKRIKTNTQFLVLTKRASRMEKMVKQVLNGNQPPENVWLGVTIEDNEYVSRADYLRNTPASIRWICAEPLLGSLDNLDLTDIDWVVVGGESGYDDCELRPIKLEWVRKIRDRCLKKEIPFMFKHWGHKYCNPDRNDPTADGDRCDGCRLDGREWEQYPNPREKSGILTF